MAKASQLDTTRRALLSAGLAAAALPIPAPCAAAATTPDDPALITRVRQMSAVLKAAIKVEMSAEGTPEHKELVEESERLQAEFDELSEEVWAQPVRTWNDVAVRAEIADYWADHEPDGTLCGLTSACGADHAATQLLVAVLAMGAIN
jgi:hypothetical protein